MGEFTVKGPKALELLQHISSNDVSALIDGQAQYTCMPNDKGGIIDDMIIYRKSAEDFLLVVNAANIEKDWNWIQKHNHAQATLENISDVIALLAVQGPNAIKVIQKGTSIDLNQIPYYHFIQGNLWNIDNIIISNTGYTGSGGFELYIPKDHAVTIWNALMEAGKEFNILPIGLAARDTLRLEKGFCLYGNDIDDTTNPIEAGLGWITKLNKEDFVGKSFAAKLKEAGIAKKLVGLKLLDKGIARQGYEVCDEQGNTIGKVTSGAQTPSLEYPIAMAYIDKPYFKTDSNVYVKIREKLILAKVVKMPFLS
jgi:aminomethyltransferase